MATTIGLCMAAALVLSGAQRKTRTLGWDPDRPIAERLQADDEVVLLERRFEPMQSERRLTWQEIVQNNLRRSDVVVILDVDRVECVLAERGTWISTRASGIVHETLWSAPSTTFAPGQRLDAHRNDGQLTIGGVIVRAKRIAEADIPKMPVNTRYLLFLRTFREDGRLYMGHTPLVVAADRLSYTEPVEEPGQLRNPLEGHTLTEVARLIRQLAAKQASGI